MDLLYHRNNDIIIPALLRYLDGDQHIEVLDKFYKSLRSYKNDHLPVLIEGEYNK